MAVIRRRIIGKLPENHVSRDDKILPPSEVFNSDEPPEDQIFESIATSEREVDKLLDSEEEHSVDAEPHARLRIEKKMKIKKTGVNPIEDIMLALRQGETVSVMREGLNSYSVAIVPSEIIISKAGFQRMKRGLTGKQYWEEVLNPEFEQWIKRWGTLTYSEKLSYAVTHKIEWVRVEDNERMDVMHLTEAVRKAENIEKYKPEYRKRTARNKIRG
jgi:hypothetical protein